MEPLHEKEKRMKEFTFKKIDAFATTKSGGNPAGYVSLEAEDCIEKDEMLRIARELKGYVNEVGYIHSINEDTFQLKYYSSEREVEFCGHATIAIMYDIIKNTDSLMSKPEIDIITNKGRLIVENLIHSKDAVFIMSPAPEFRTNTIHEKEIASALNMDVGTIDKKYAIAIVNAGLETLIVPIKTLQSILSIAPDLEVLKQFCKKNNIDIIEVFCDEVHNKENNFRTRVFAPTFGYLEDPATGSGNSAFGYFLLKNDLWDGDTLMIEQNKYLENYNIVQLKTRFDTNRNTRVLFGGGAVTRIEGKYILP
jgi:PhzF family phenazine biosynthesis protein